MDEAAENYGPFQEISREEDAGAAFVLQSKGDQISALSSITCILLLHI